jgi:hypothetical protein
MDTVVPNPPVRAALSGRDRRHQPRDAVIGTLWLIDNVCSSVIRCNCVDVSGDGMRLSAPDGAPVQIGRNYELCSHLPGQSPPPGLGLIISRHATVVWVSENGHGLEFGVTLDSARCRIRATEAIV